MGGMEVLRSPVSIGLIRYGYVPLLLVGGGTAAVLLAAGGASKWALVALVLAAVAVSVVAEQILPYDEDWNRDRGDSGRDVVHARAGALGGHLKSGHTPTSENRP